MPTKCKGRSSAKCHTRKCKYVRSKYPYCRRTTRSRCAKRSQSECNKPRCKWASGPKYRFCRKTKNHSRKRI